MFVRSTEGSTSDSSCWYPANESICGHHQPISNPLTGRATLGKDAWLLCLARQLVGATIPISIYKISTCTSSPKRIHTSSFITEPSSSYNFTKHVFIHEHHNELHKNTPLINSTTSPHLHMAQTSPHLYYRTPYSIISTICITSPISNT